MKIIFVYTFLFAFFILKDSETGLIHRVTLSGADLLQSMTCRRCLSSQQVHFLGLVWACMTKLSSRSVTVMLPGLAVTHVCVCVWRFIDFPTGFISRLITYISMMYHLHKRERETVFRLKLEDFNSCQSGTPDKNPPLFKMMLRRADPSLFLTKRKRATCQPGISCHPTSISWLLPSARC